MTISLIVVPISSTLNKSQMTVLFCHIYGEEKSAQIFFYLKEEAFQLINWSLVRWKSCDNLLGCNNGSIHGA